jgi:ATP-dependent helicase HrpB
VEWDEGHGGVKATHRLALGDVTLREARWEDPDRGDVAAAVLHFVRRAGLNVLTWSAAAAALRARIGFLGSLDGGGGGDWPDVSDAGLLRRLDDWLGPACAGVTRRAQLEAVDTAAAVASLLSREQRARLETLAPAHVPLPGGRRAAVDYTGAGGPAVHVKLQEVLGATRIEGVAGGRVPVAIHLLSPAMRPIQVLRS